MGVTGNMCASPLHIVSVHKCVSVASGALNTPMQNLLDNPAPLHLQPEERE